METLTHKEFVISPVLDVVVSALEKEVVRIVVVDVASSVAMVVSALVLPLASPTPPSEQ